MTPDQSMRAEDIVTTLRAQRRMLAAVHESLSQHDAEHAYLNSDHPSVLACIWCQS